MATSESMRALVVTKTGTMVLSEVAIPVPPVGWARVRVRAAGICATDLAILDGQARVQFPVIPGHEWMGVVDQVGDSADSEWLGARVSGENEVSCLRCEQCRSGRPRWCAQYQQIGFGRYGGSYAEYLIAPVYDLHRLGPVISDDQGALLEPMAVALGILGRADLRIGETLTIIGDGPIGLHTLLVAKAMGARRILLSGERSTRLDMAQHMGAYRVVNHRTGDLQSLVDQYHGRSDVVVEATGSELGLQQAIAAAKPEGRVIVAGFAHGGSAVIAPDAIHLPDLQVIGAGNNPGWMGRAVALVEDELLSSERLITHRFAIEEFEAAFHQLREKPTDFVKSLLVF